LATTAFVAAAVAGAKTTTSAMAPATPNVGDLWYDTVGGQLYIYYNDGNSSQWVVTVNQNLGGLYLPLTGGTLTGNLTVNGTTALGTATATTPISTDNSTNIATTAFVKATAGPSSSLPIMDGTAAIGSSALFARGDHVHPTDTSRAAQASLANYLPLTGGSLSGNLSINAQLNVGNIYFNNSGYGINANGTSCLFNAVTISSNYLQASTYYGQLGSTLNSFCGNSSYTWGLGGASNWSGGGGLYGRIDTTAAYLAGWLWGSGSLVGTISTNGSSTSYNSTSDERLKKNIRHISEDVDVGDMIDRIRPVAFEWRDRLSVIGPGEHLQARDGMKAEPLGRGQRAGKGISLGHGFVAQELIQVAPFAVHAPNLGTEPLTNVDDKSPVHPWGVDNSKLVPYLVAELQMLRKRVAQLEGR
jgi:hypothetical protein